MEKSSEGVVISSLQSELGELQSALSHLDSLPKLARKQFVNDIERSIGSIDDPHLPKSIQPILSKLLDAAKVYLETGNVKAFFPLCEIAISICGQGWSYLSYWISSEQNLCYSIFWSLKASLEKHRKQLLMYASSRNDGAPKMQFYKLPLQSTSRRD